MRLRIVFSKTGSLRYTGHLDLQTVWERTVRRAGLPLKYTQGFHPGPRIQIAAALPLGYAGCAEIVDIWLETDPGDCAEVRKRLQAGSPPGLTVLGVEAVDERGPALQTRVVSAEYTVTLPGDLSPAALQLRLDGLMAAASLPRRWREKDYDLRPLVESLSLGAPEGAAGVRIFMRLAARQGATGRPEEVLAALGLPFETARIERTRLVLQAGEG